MFVIQAHSDPNQLCLVPKCETGMGLRQVLVSAGGCWWILLITGGCWWDLPATPELTPPTPLHSSSQKHQLPLLLSVNLLYEIWHWNASLIKQITAVISYRINKAIVDVTLDFSFLLSVKHFFFPLLLLPNRHETFVKTIFAQKAVGNRSWKDTCSYLILWKGKMKCYLDVFSC